MNIRTVDDVQYQNRMRSFDFDMTTVVWAQSLSPGNEQRDLFGSQAADRPGSRNMRGIKNPAVDALIDRIIFAKDRAELIAACKAMDRVLLWNFYVRAAIHLRIPALCALGSLQPSRAVAEIRRFRISRRCGGMTPTRQPRSASAVEGFAHGAISPVGTRSVSASAR